MGKMYRAIVIEEKFTLSTDADNNQVLRNTSYDSNFRKGDVLTRYIFHNETLLRKDNYRVHNMASHYVELIGASGEVFRCSYNHFISGRLDCPPGKLKLSYYWRIYENE